MKSQFTRRELKVLQATVDRYIATAEPVGSKVLVEEYDFDISPATIRNVMNMLNRCGLLYQPHTSAGRIPSDSGYRVYVDELVAPSYELASNTAQLLSSQVDLRGNTSLESLLRGTAQILATLSGCIALITAPNIQIAKIRHLQLVMVDTRKIMVVAVSDSYYTSSVLIDLPDETKADMLEAELHILNNFLNAHLRDKRWSDLNNSLQWDELDRQFQQYADLLQRSLQRLMQINYSALLGQLFISGLTEILRQPEFANTNQIQGIVHFLEGDRATLMSLIADPSDSSHRVNVKIGSEISLESIQHCTLISSTYSCDDMPLGSVGVLGPTRMDYERAIASVQATSAHLSEVMAHR
jgi:heat-inducible transcriptional repressor